MERLQKVIAHAGVASRRKAEELILQGKVRVNGEWVTALGTQVSKMDTVEVNGVPIDKEEPVCFLFYKPVGVISSTRDEKGRKVATDFFGEIEQRIFPIGRLDYNTSGLLLLTNDGELANRLMHPRYHIDKTYIAKVKGFVSRSVQRKLQNGVVLEDGKTAPASVKVLSSERKKNISIVELTIHEGRNRQVRRMFETMGLPVLKLKREGYAFLTLRGMNPGDWRELTPHEIKRLRSLTVT